MTIMKKENLLILTVLHDGSIVFIRDENLTLQQERTLKNITLCCDKPSYVLKFVLYIEGILYKMANTFNKK